MTALTVFTPTYNRAHLLGRLYASLLRQTCDDFRWLIIDDGSTDGTGELVADWISEGRISIEYHWKANGGMHTAHNLAYNLIETEINVCIDSDDWMPDDAVALIVSRWRALADDPRVAGIVGLDQSPDGALIGTPLPPNGTRCTLTNLYARMAVRGDKKLVYRSSITQSFPRYPEFPGERLVPLAWLYNLIDQDFELVAFNDVYVIVDYQPGGSSDNVIKQYFQSPQGFREARIVSIRNAGSLKDKIRNVVHLGVSCFILGQWQPWLRSPAPWLSALMWPVSFAAYLYLVIRQSATERKRIKIARQNP